MPKKQTLELPIHDLQSGKHPLGSSTESDIGYLQHPGMATQHTFMEIPVERVNIDEPAHVIHDYILYMICIYIYTRVYK